MTWILLVFYTTWAQPEMRKFEFATEAACMQAEQFVSDNGAAAMCMEGGDAGD